MVVVNGARMRDLRLLRLGCRQAAAAAGCPEPEILPTSAADAGEGLASRAAAAGAPLVIVAGGDGTVRACAQALAGTSVPMAIIPAGSANLVAWALRIPAGLSAALNVAFSGRERRIDLGAADGLRFAAMAGIGLDAAVVAATSAAAKRLAGWPAYAVAATGQLLRRPATFTVRCDGGEPLVLAAQSVAVGNCGLLPGGFSVMPDARLDDGVLDVAILAPAWPLGWASVGYRVLLGSRRDDSRLLRLRARQVEISADAELPRQVDGEVIGPATALSVRVEPGALLVRVPSQASPGGRRAGRRGWPAG